MKYIELGKHITSNPAVRIVIALVLGCSMGWLMGYFQTEIASLIDLL